MSHRRRQPAFSSRVPLLAWLVICAAMLAPASADQPAAVPTAKDDSSASLRFRRVYVPADQIEQLPRHGVRYVPMDAAEFERMAASLSSTRPTSEPESTRPPNVEVTRAIYEAKLSGEVLTDGKATLEIRDAEKNPRLPSVRLVPIASPIAAMDWNRIDGSGCTAESVEEHRCDCAAARDDRRRP